MKRVVLAVFLIIFSLSFSLFSHFYVNTVSVELEMLLESALQGNSDDGNIMSENIKLALDKWKKHGKIFGVLLKNSASGEMDEVFSEIEFFLNYQQSDSLEQSVTKCIFLLKSTIEREKFSFSNIF